MKPRRSFLGMAAAFFCGFRARSQQRSSAQVRVLGKFALTEMFAGMEASLVEVTIPPGEGSRAHRHPGFVLGYVLEGSMRFGVSGGAEQVISAGGVFFEPVGAVHTVSASAQPEAPVRLLAFMVAKQGSAITLPA